MTNDNTTPIYSSEAGTIKASSYHWSEAKNSFSKANNVMPSFTKAAILFGFSQLILLGARAYINSQKMKTVYKGKGVENGKFSIMVGGSDMPTELTQENENVLYKNSNGEFNQFEANETSLWFNAQINLNKLNDKNPNFTSYNQSVKVKNVKIADGLTTIELSQEITGASKVKELKLNSSTTKSDVMTQTLSDVTNASQGDLFKAACGTLGLMVTLDTILNAIQNPKNAVSEMKNTVDNTWQGCKYLTETGYHLVACVFDMAGELTGIYNNDVQIAGDEYNDVSSDTVDA